MQAIRQVAKRLDLPERAIRAWVKQGIIPVTMSGNRAYISTTWLENKLRADGKLERGSYNVQ
jgi:DNA-binding transcriptional MerR regulator